MNRSLSSRHRLLLVSQGLALACLLGGAARCSSSSGGNVVEQEEAGSASGSGGSSGGSGSSSGSSGGSSSGTASSSGSSGGTTSGSSGGTSSGVADGGGLEVEAGADGGCPSQSSSTLATKITFQTGWPSSTAGNAGMGEVNILLLTNFTGTTTLSGSSQSCGLSLPDLDLNETGMLATGGGSKILIQVPNATWDKITRTFPVTGTQSGFNPCDTLDTAASVGLLGLTNASGYGSDTKAWPPACTAGMCTPAGSFTAADLQDDDGDGNPGITALPSTASGYALPPTSDVFAQVADQVYIVSRNEITLMGMHTGPGCNQGTGTAVISLFDNHVVGCHVTSLHGTAGPCSDSQVNFLDVNRTIYGYDMTAGDVASTAHPIMGTVTTVQIAAGAKCSDARAAFSPTFD
jgi:hypothetical protein